MKYILKDGSEVESIPIGKAKIKIGDKQKNGRLTICDRGPGVAGNNGAKVICQCECGKYTLTGAAAFYKETTKSCGCYNLEVRKKLCRQLGKQPKDGKDYTKTINPFYTFLKRLDKKDENNSFYWLIKCKQCGQTYEVIPAYLISESRRRGNNPCDCWRQVSKGVILIKQILEDNNITYKQEYCFKDCLSPLGNQLKFDFYLPEKNILIEYDGEQHFYPTSFGGTKSGEERLKENKEYDKIKDEFCKKKKIKLIRISYKDYDKITLNMILGV